MIERLDMGAVLVLLLKSRGEGQRSIKRGRASLRITGVQAGCLVAFFHAPSHHPTVSAALRLYEPDSVLSIAREILSTSLLSFQVKDDTSMPAATILHSNRS